MRNRSGILLALLSALARPATGGVRFTATTHSEGSYSRAISLADNKVEGWVSGANARISIVASHNPMLPARDYLLTRDGGKTVFRVSPKSRSFANWSTGGASGASSSVMAMRFENPKVEKISDEASGRIAGVATRHYRFRTTYASEMQLIDVPKKSTITRVEDVWLSTEPGEAGLALWLSREPSKTGDAALDRLLAGQAARLAGFPLRRVTQTTVKDDRGSEQTTLTVLEVTEFRTAKVPDSLFDLPSNFTDATAKK
jgi:hypothetical protein